MTSDAPRARVGVVRAGQCDRTQVPDRRELEDESADATGSTGDQKRLARYEPGEVEGAVRRQSVQR